MPTIENNRIEQTTPTTGTENVPKPSALAGVFGNDKILILLAIAAVVATPLAPLFAANTTGAIVCQIVLGLAATFGVASTVTRQKKE